MKNQPFLFQIAASHTNDHDLLLLAILIRGDQIKSIANETKRHVDIPVYVQALFTFLPRNKQNEN